MRCLISTIIIVSITHFSAYAQFDFRFKKLTVQDGLSQSAISSVIQDQLGFLWIGTRDGLNRYDGYNFKQYYYQPNDSSSLPHSTIHHLSLSPDQQLWLATPGYICQYKGGSEGFASYPIVFQGQSDKTLKVNRFFWKNNYEVLLVTTQGLVLFNLKTKKCSIPKKYESFKGQDILSVFLNAHSYNWVASNTGIYRAPTSNPSQWQRLLPSKQKSTYLTQTSTQRIFASVDQQLFMWDPTQQKFRLIHEVSGNQPILEIKELANKQLWVTWGNVTIFSPEGKYLDEITHEPNNPFSISQDVVNNVYESQDGIIWLGTNGFGLNKLDPKLARFGYIGAFLETKITLSHMYTQAIYTPNDTLLYITVSEGLNQINFTQQTSQAFNNRKSRRSNQFNCIMPNSSGGEIWLGSNDGLWKFKKGQFISVKNKRLREKIRIYQIEKTAPNILMMATRQGTLLWNQKTDSITQLTKTYGAVNFLRMSNGFLEGSESGLREFDFNGRLKHHFKADKQQKNNLQANVIKCIFQDSKNRIWIGSWGGGLSLFRPDTHTFVHYTEANGLPNSVVYGILEDNQGQLWLSTNKGISCFNLQTKTFRNFYEIDGLQGDEFNTRSFFKSSNDRMYFGGINGLTYFNPKNALKSQKYIPKTVLINFYAEGKPGHQINENFRVKKILHNKRVAIDWHIKDFSFEIAGLGYSLPAHTSYRYRITPFQKEWITLNNRRFIHFTNLPPGKYTLQIKAANSEGQWEAQGLIIEVEILGPFWRTWWFITLCIVLFIGGGAFWYFYRTHQLKKKALKLQKTVNERTQEIQLKNEEIAAQNEELQMQAEMLTDKNASLETIKKNLENKVKERTYELTQLNEDLLSQNTRLEQFAFITAHNIRGPIARIQGLLQILPENEQNQIIQYLHVSVNELDQVIRDLVTILDVRHGVDQHFEEIDIEAQLQETIDSLKEDIEKRNAVINMGGFASLTLVGVKPYFKSVFHNLIHNALKYSKDDEHPVINIAHQATDTHHNISIADNGLGIEMRYAKEKIFHLYQRFHPERPGKGFGLYLVKTQLEAMGANIAVKSKLGVGTTFTISFPLPKQQLTEYNSQA